MMATVPHIEFRAEKTLSTGQHKGHKVYNYRAKLITRYKPCHYTITDRPLFISKRAELAADCMKHGRWVRTGTVSKHGLTRRAIHFLIRPKQPFENASRGTAPVG